MTRKTIDTFLVTYDKYDHDFNLIAQGVVQGFTTQKEAFNCAMKLNQKSINTQSRLIFSMDFKTYRKTLKSHILAVISDERLERIFD